MPDITVKRFSLLAITLPVQRSGFDYVDRYVLAVGSEGVVHFQLLDYQSEAPSLTLNYVFSALDYSDWACKTDTILEALKEILAEENASTPLDEDVTIYRSAANKDLAIFVAPCGDEFQIQLTVIQRLVDELSIPNELEKVKTELAELRAYIGKQTEAWQQ